MADKSISMISGLTLIWYYESERADWNSWAFDYFSVLTWALDIIFCIDRFFFKDVIFGKYLLDFFGFWKFVVVDFIWTRVSLFLFLFLGLWTRGLDGSSIADFGSNYFIGFDWISMSSLLSNGLCMGIYMCWWLCADFCKRIRKVRFDSQILVDDRRFDWLGLWFLWWLDY